MSSWWLLVSDLAVLSIVGVFVVTWADRGD